MSLIQGTVISDRNLLNRFSPENMLNSYTVNLGCALIDNAVHFS